METAWKFWQNCWLYPQLAFAFAVGMTWHSESILGLHDRRKAEDDIRKASQNMG